ncbi:MAG TPA: hypothetical protein VNN80_34230 [Polyangiaceae bacterium]|nr:hypothetical protein [Polyangiaceae bacterium]
MAASHSTQESRVAELTGSEGSEALPPRAMRLAGDVTALGYGGAVVTDDGAALIGVVVSGVTERCTERDPSATTIALRLSAFRRMLLDAATHANVELRLESRDVDALSVPDCSAE